MTKITVDILGYISDCYEDISDSEREQIAEQIASKFDYTQVYDMLDEWVNALRK